MVVPPTTAESEAAAAAIPQPAYQHIPFPNPEINNLFTNTSTSANM